MFKILYFVCVLVSICGGIVLLGIEDSSKWSTSMAIAAVLFIPSFLLILCGMLASTYRVLVRCHVPTWLIILCYIPYINYFALAYLGFFIQEYDENYKK